MSFMLQSVSCSSAFRVRYSVAVGLEDSMPASAALCSLGPLPRRVPGNEAGDFAPGKLPVANQFLRDRADGRVCSSHKTDRRAPKSSAVDLP